VIVLEQTAEPLTTDDVPVSWCSSHNGQDQPVAWALVVALDVIVPDELTDGSPERPFPDENHAVQTGFLDASYEALRVRVEIRGTGQQFNGFNTRARHVSRTPGAQIESKPERHDVLQSSANISPARTAPAFDAYPPQKDRGAVHSGRILIPRSGVPARGSRREPALRTTTLLAVDLAFNVRKV
jgi:hypothetical protein